MVSDIGEQFDDVQLKKSDKKFLSVALMKGVVRPGNSDSVQGIVDNRNNNEC